MTTTERDPFQVLQVSNISPLATKEQVQQLFSNLGKILEFKLYPTDQHVTSQTTQKFAFIKYDDEKAVELGQHLTNAVLIDHALLCTPSLSSLLTHSCASRSDVIPEEEVALNMGGPALPGQRNLPPHLSSKIDNDADGVKQLWTIDPTLDQLGLPQYPCLPVNTEPSKVEEIRRTVYVGNLPKGVIGQDVVNFFNSNIGEVMYVRLTTGPETLPCAYAYVEFSSQASVPIALQNNMMIEFEGRTLKIQHSRVAIIKPQRKTGEQAVEEIEEAIRKKDSGLAYMAARSRSRSPSKRIEERKERSRSRRRSRTPPRRRSRSREIRERRRSRSRDRERERERDRRRSRSRDRDRDRRRRSRSRDRRSRSRDRRDRGDRRRSRSRSRDRKKDRKERKRSRSRTPKKKDVKRERSRSPERKKDRKDKDKDKDKDKEKDKDKDKEKDREKEKEKDRSKKDDKDKEKKGGKEKRRVNESDEETALREKLLEKVAARQSEDSEASRITHQRKRRSSDSN